MLGERIRKLRKQKKMTLEALAGKELTKGMLSLIENNKARPSMESLAYIAGQLEVELSDLLEVISSEELRGALEQAEKLYNTDFDKQKDKYKQLIELIEPYADNLSHGYEAARLLELYSYALSNEKKQAWQEVSERAAKMYDQMNITANRASIGIFRALRKFNEHDYSKSLEILLRERTEIELNHAFIDPMTRLDLDYYEATFYFAVGDSDSATRVMENALTFSKEKRIFYLVDDLYRLATAQAMMVQNDEKKEYYLQKLNQYAEFADHMPSIVFCKLIKLMSLISDQQKYTKALEEIDLLFSQQASIEFTEPWFNLEKGKALYYLGHYEEALKSLEKVVIPPSIHHPFDLSFLYVMDSYKALSHVELGNVKEALTLAITAIKKFEPLPDTPYKTFVLETYDKIRKD